MNRGSNKLSPQSTGIFLKAIIILCLISLPIFSSVAIVESRARKPQSLEESNSEESDSQSQDSQSQKDLETLRKSNATSQSQGEQSQTEQTQEESINSNEQSTQKAIKTTFPDSQQIPPYTSQFNVPATIPESATQENSESNHTAKENQVISSNPLEGSRKGIIVTVWIWQETKDCLWQLAKKYYKDPWAWKKIYQANRHTILDPNVIRPKQKIFIPQDES